MRARGAGFVTAAVVGLALPLTAWAHERWFVADPGTGAPAFFREFGWHLPVAVLLGVLVLIAAKIIDAWLRRLQFGKTATLSLSRLAGFVPFTIGLATAVVLIASALDRALLAPHLILSDTPSGTALVIAQLAVAAALILGLFARMAAGGLIVLAVWSFAQFGLPAVENLIFIGIGLFLFVWGRGRLALGAVFSRIVFAMDTAHMKPVALSVLRIVTGIALVWGGIDKLWHPELHLAVIQGFADWNPLVLARAVWPSLGENLYVFLLAAAEITIGLLVLCGWLLRPVAALVILLFLFFSLFFPIADLIGHLPYLAVFLGFVLLGKSIERSDRL